MKIDSPFQIDFFQAPIIPRNPFNHLPEGKGTVNGQCHIF